jgi:hypothetical protein
VANRSFFGCGCSTMEKPLSTSDGCLIILRKGFPVNFPLSYVPQETQLLKTSLGRYILKK